MLTRFKAEPLGVRFGSIPRYKESSCPLRLNSTAGMTRIPPLFAAVKLLFLKTSFLEAYFNCVITIRQHINAQARKDVIDNNPLGTSELVGACAERECFLF